MPGDLGGYPVKPENHFRVSPSFSRGWRKLQRGRTRIGQPTIRPLRPVAHLTGVTSAYRTQATKIWSNTLKPGIMS